MISPKSNIVIGTKPQNRIIAYFATNDMKKGEKLDNLYIETMAAEGKCVAKTGGLVVFVTGGAPGDTVEAVVTRSKKNFLEAAVTNIVKASPVREVPFCEHFGLCGGCTWQHISYSTQLQYKQLQVKDNLERIGGLPLPAVNPIRGSAHVKAYRNKLDFTFTHGRWLTRNELQSGATKTPGLGFHIPRMFDKVFDVNHCHLQPEPSNAIRLAVKQRALECNIPFFDLRAQAGFLRNLTIRTANTGEVMVILQVTAEKMEWINDLLQCIVEQFPQVSSVQYVVNNKRNDTFHDLEVKTWRGNSYITERMPLATGEGNLLFRIGPKSFYQTNSAQAHVLYQVVWRMAKLTGKELVYDLYTGTGTIASFVAAHAGKVIGLEYVEEAVTDAKTNSLINNITNTEFFAGDIKELLNETFLQQHGHPDVVITDPPRAGMHEEVCRMILKAGPQRIVYVSCNPATQARDVKILSEKYTIEEIQPVDMFPHTMHVENVVGLVRMPNRGG